MPQNLKYARFCLKPLKKLFTKMALFCRKQPFFLRLCPDSRKTTAPYMAENRQEAIFCHPCAHFWPFSALFLIVFT